MNHLPPVALGAAGLLAGLLVACSTPPGKLVVQGEVATDLVEVSVPPLTTPTVDLDAGFATPTTTTPTTITMGTSPTAAELGLGSVAGVAAVSVREGDTVAAGDTLVQLDDQLLRAALRSAQAAAEVAAAQVDVLEAAKADAEDAKAEIAEKRADVVDALAELRERRAEVTKAIRQLTSTRDDLIARRAKARASRAELVSRRRQAEKLLGSLPPAPTPTPPGTPSREQVEASIAQLTTAIGQLDAGLKKLDAGLAQLTAGLKQARTGLAKLDKGIARATDGLHDLDDAAEAVEDAIAQLDRLRRLAAVAVDTAAIPVELARVQLAQTAVTAPGAGTVVSVANLGAQLAPGATLVQIRPAEATRLTTWLSPGQVAGVCTGDAASIVGDWMAGESAAAEVTRIATRAEFPPTDQPTDEVHLTRAFLVELTTPADLPSGAPVTISIQPCRATTSGAPGR